MTPSTCDHNLVPLTVTAPAAFWPAVAVPPPGIDPCSHYPGTAPMGYAAFPPVFTA